MKRRLSRLVCAVLTLMLLISVFSGCGQQAKQENGTQSSAASSAATAAQESSVPAKPDTSPITLTVFKDSPKADDSQWGNDPVSKKITEMTGVTLDEKFATTSDHQELSTLMASGSELPDLIVTNANQPMAYTLYKQGFVQPLNKLAEKYSPDFFKFLPKDEDKFYARDDGNLYCTADWYGEPESLKDIPIRTYNSVGIMINQQMYQTIGSPAVDTLEGFKSMLVKAKESFPKVPYILWMDDYYVTGMLQNIFGGTNKYSVGSDGKLQSAYKSDSFKNAVSYINELYRAGVINPENFTAKYEQFQQIAKNDQIFTFFGYTWDLATEVKDGLSANAPYKVIDLPTAPGVSRDQIKIPDERLGIGGWNGVHISKDCKNPARAIQYITFMLSEAGQLLQRCGIEGKDYVMDDQGFPNRTQSRRDAENNQGWAEGVQKTLGIQNGIDAWFISQETCCLSEKYWTCEFPLYQDLAKIYPKYVTDTRLIDLVDTVQEEEYKVMKTQIDDLWSKTKTQLYLSKTPEAFEATYKTFLEKAEKLGLSKLESYISDRYQTWKNKLGK